MNNIGTLLLSLKGLGGVGLATALVQELPSEIVDDQRFRPLHYTIYNEVRGTEGSDNLSGSAEIDLLISEAGNDTLRGYEGDDYLDGGDGNDKLQKIKTLK